MQLQIDEPALDFEGSSITESSENLANSKQNKFPQSNIELTISDDTLEDNEQVNLLFFY